MKKKLLISSLLIFFLLPCLLAQISEGGTPPGFRYPVNEHKIPSINVPAPNVERLKEEDEFYRKNGMAIRFAESVSIDVDLARDGFWEVLPDGGRLCRLNIVSPRAQALILYYRKFIIPEGGKLFLFSADKLQVIGAFTSQSNPQRQTFATEMIRGEKVTLEYYEPSGTIAKPQIVIEEAGYVYRTADRFFNPKGFGTSDTCEVNVNCPEGENWQNQKNGIVRIIVKAGFSSLWCTGSLVNNARNDFKPYFLTADHCGANATPANYNQWIFYFRYEGPDCENPISDTSFKSYTMVGAAKVAASGGAGVASDFKLLRLNETVPGAYNPFFNGWSITGERSPNGVTIHHPDGDIKKISTYTDTIRSSSWGSIPNTHWRVVWSQTQTNWGVTEGGSSGSPLFDNNGRIIGQLTGGEASCRYTSKPDYYGKFSYSWNGNPAADTTHLKPWLDPDNTGITEINGVVSVNEIVPIPQPLHIFPNPSDGVVFIDDEMLAGNDVIVKITSLIGHEVLSNSYPDNNQTRISLDISQLQKGIYFLTVIINNEARTVKLVR